MQQRMFMVVLTAFFLFFVSGCSTLADAEAAKGTGTTRTYNKPFDTVWAASLDAVNASGLALVAEEKDKGKILAQKGMSALSYGEEVVIFVENSDVPGATRVEVVSKRALATTIFSTNWETVLLADLDNRLK